MKRIHTSLAAILSIAFLSIFISSISSCSAETPLRGEVIRVTDGDTVVIEPEKGGKNITCRLYGIDSPETEKRDRRGQPYAKEAAEELKKLILGQQVEVATTGEKTHNRDVCIIRNNGMDINREMIKRGYAWAYRKHLESPYASEYIEAENEARVQRSGIWRQANPLPPWEFKKKYWNK